MEISFTSLAIVAAVGFAAPLLLGLVPQLRSYEASLVRQRRTLRR